MFDPWGQTHTPQYVFPYQVRISNAGRSAEAKLTRRHWVIRDGEQEHVVEGPGVIGQYPEIDEGCSDFIYESCCPIQSLEGSMEGGFYFKDSASGEEFYARINPFKLEFEKGSALLELNSVTGAVAVMHQP
jgi:ApaG protein